MIRKLIAAAWRRVSPPPPTWGDEARAAGFWPVRSGWDWLHAVDACGRVVRSESTEYSEVEDEPDACVRHRVLAQASLEHPALDSLRPIRGTNDPECPRCEGTGTRIGAPRMVCYCGGIGWLPDRCAAELKGVVQAAELGAAGDVRPRISPE